MNPELPAGLWACQDCGKCTAVCPVARTGLGFSPRSLIQRAIRENAADALRSRALFACLGCDRCRTVCMSGTSLSTLMLGLRAAAFEAGPAGRPAHAGALQTLMRLQTGDTRPQRLGWLDGSLRTATEGETVYFVGCAPFFAPLFRHLEVEPLATAANAVRLLNSVGIEPALLPDERCCGHDLLWQGDVETFRHLAERNLESIRAAGTRLVVFSCPECLRTFRIDYPRLFGALGFDTVHITELLAAPERGFRPGPLRDRVTFQDPCRLGNHLGIFDAPRRLLESVPGLELVEMEHSRDQALCCGGTCWMECGAAVQALQNRRLAEARATGAHRLVTACPKCDIHLRCALAGFPDRPAPEIENIVDLLAEAAGLAPGRKGAGKVAC